MTEKTEQRICIVASFIVLFFVGWIGVSTYKYHASERIVVNKKFMKEFWEIKMDVSQCSRYLELAKKHNNPELIREATALNDNAMALWRECEVINARLGTIKDSDRITEIQKKFLIEMGEWPDE